MPKKAIYILSADRKSGNFAGEFPGTPAGEFLLERALSQLSHYPEAVAMVVNNIPDDQKMPETWHATPPASDVSGYEAHIGMLRQALEQAHHWCSEAIAMKDATTLPVALAAELDTALKDSQSRFAKNLGAGVFSCLKHMAKDIHAQQRANSRKKHKLDVLRSVVRGHYRQLKLDYASLQVEALRQTADAKAIVDVLSTVLDVIAAPGGFKSEHVHSMTEKGRELVAKFKELHAPYKIAVAVSEVQDRFGEDLAQYITQASIASLSLRNTGNVPIPVDTPLPMVPREALQKIASGHPERSLQFRSLFAFMVDNGYHFISFNR